MNDEVRRLRLEADNLRSDVERLSRIDVQAPESLLVQTAEKGAYPTSASAYYWCEIMKIPAGSPTEGTAVTPAGTGRNVWCYNVGSTVPPQGTLRVAIRSGGRYVINHCC